MGDHLQNIVQIGWRGTNNEFVAHRIGDDELTRVTARLRSSLLHSGDNVLRRVLMLFPVMILVSLMVFSIIRLVPGDIVEIKMAE